MCHFELEGSFLTLKTDMRCSSRPSVENILLSLLLWVVSSCFPILFIISWPCRFILQQDWGGSQALQTGNHRFIDCRLLCCVKFAIMERRTIRNVKCSQSIRLDWSIHSSNTDLMVLSSQISPVTTVTVTLILFGFVGLFVRKTIFRFFTYRKQIYIMARLQ